LCSAPYAKEKLSHLRVRQFRIETEVGIVDLAPSRAQSVRTVGQLRMLHVGRTVRTKGLRDAVRALARLSDFPGITLDVAGAGEDLDECRKEAEALGVDRRIRFLGRVPPQEVDRLYQEADLFLFPSFREPTGIVLFEAMRHGLPVITTDIGGPGHIVTDDCGIRVPADNPDQFARDLANAIKRIALDPALLGVLGQGARARVTEIGLWDNKVERIMQVYKETIERAGS
jgi:glycosyltransferase involved in cell wall biosynthesis